MTIRIKHEGLPLPVNPVFTLYIANLLAPYENKNLVTINFGDPNFSSDTGRNNPVEIRLVNDGDGWQFCGITVFHYIGRGYRAELEEDLYFNFSADVFQNRLGTIPIKQASEIYKVWESNFVYYATVAKAYEITVNGDN